jgi:hypothetical protein
MTIPVQHDDDDFYINTTLADAQATIAALQAQLATCFKLSGADPDGNEDWRLAPHAVEEVTRLHNDCDELGDETGALREQLTRRTAELEAAKRERDEWIVKWDEHDHYPKGYVTAQIQLRERVQAELERVRADNKALDEWRADVTVSLQRPGGAFFVDVPQHIKDLVKERDDLRTLLLALPKVEGAVVVSNGYVKDSTRCHALFGADEDAALYAALLQHRQGME